MQALARQVLPGEAGKFAGGTLAKLAMLASLPAMAIPVVLVLVFVVMLSAIGGQPSAAATCDGPASQAAPTSLSGPPAYLIPIYQAASTAAGLNPEGPAILAGINRVETDFGSNLNVSSAGAIGWMQFEPATWAEYGNGGDPYNPHDAIFAAARLLKANGAPKNWYNAIYGYNHAGWYVEEVERYARQYASEVGTGQNGGTPAAPEATLVSTCGPGAEEGAAAAGAGAAAAGEGAAAIPGARAKLLPNGLVAPPVAAPPAVRAMIEAGNQIAALPYVWGGHHALGSPTNGYDCSSAVAYVMFPAHLLPPFTAGFSHGDFYTGLWAALFVPGGGVGDLQSGKGKWVTIYTENTGGHVFLEIAGVRFDDSADYLRNGKGPGGTNVSMWQPPISPSTFTTSHPAGF